MVKPILSEADKDRIQAAVGEAERRTTGEIVCVVTREVSSYVEVPIAAAVIGALAVAPLLVALGVEALFATGWQAGHAAATSGQVRQALLDYALLQSALFALFGFVAAVPAVRRRLTPASLKRARVHAEAYQQFLATGLSAVPGRRGVLIFTSVGDHLVEVMADKAVHEACGEATWRAAVDAVRASMKQGDAAGGLIRGVQICGEALAAAFPAEADNPNTHPDRPVEL